MGSESSDAGHSEQAGTGRHRRPERGPGDRDAEPEPGPATGSDRLSDKDSRPGPERYGRHGKPEIGPARDPVSDTGPSGLRMFNIGSIPASVTPPRTWRRAQWFTVIASVAALAGLVAVGAALVGPVHPTGRIDAMPPYFPNGTPLAAIGTPADIEKSDYSTPESPTMRSGTSSATSTGTSTVGQLADASASTIMAGAAAAATTASMPPDPPPDDAPPVATVGTLPVITTVSSVGDPVVDPAKLIKRTRTFFAEVTSNAQAAAQLTVGTAHDDAVALIQRKYGHVSAIQVRSISLDPTSGLTVCVVRVTDKDGTTQTQQTRLRFTLTSDPKITNPGG